MSNDVAVSAGSWAPYREKTFNGNLGNIGSNAFSGNTDITAIRWYGESGVTMRFGYRSFKNCTSLKSVEMIGDGTGFIYGEAFAGCTSLETVVMSGLTPTTTTSSSNTFSGCTALTTVDMAGYYSYYGDIFIGCTSLREVTWRGETGGQMMSTTLFGYTTTKPALTVLRLPDLTRVYRSQYSSSMFIRNCPNLTDVYWGGTVANAQADFTSGIVSGCPSFTVHCTDGDYVVPSTL